MNVFLRRLSIAILLFAFSEVQSQELVRISADEAVRIGLEKNKNILINESKIRAADSKIEESKAQLLPSLKLGASYTRLSDVEPFKIPGMNISIFPTILNMYNTKLTVAQPVFTGFRLNSAVSMNEALANATKYDLETTKIGLISDIKTMYWTYFKLQKTKQSLQDNIKQLDAHIKDIENMIAAGLTIENDLLKVKVQKSNLELSIVEIENNIDMAGITLATLMGIDANTKFEITDNPENINSELMELQLSRDTAISKRPELKAIEERINASKYGIDMVKSGYYPQVFLSANYNYSNPNQRYMPQKEEFRGTWDISLGLSMNLWDWNTTSLQAQQAQEQLLQAELSKSMIVDGLTQEVSQAVMTYNRSFDKMNATKVLLQQAKENLRVTQEKYKAGAAISSELLDAETSLLMAEINMITSQTDYQMSLIKYIKATGFKNY